MKVTLIEFTGSGRSNPADYAAALLIFTKSTRLQMSPNLLDEILEWPEHKKLEELQYMANTIPSSFEFIDYTFLIEGVTRAFTHQFVRSRVASFAQQTMRVLDVSGWDYDTGPSIIGDEQLKYTYDAIMKSIGQNYKILINFGAKIEDARGILPTNILTNIVAKFNMRAFIELVRKRSSSRVQQEYREALELMVNVVRERHPWIDLFLARSADKAAHDLDRALQALPKEQGLPMIKLLDIIRSE